MQKEPSATNRPFQTLGTRLKYLREQTGHSLPEVSGAVEIEETKLKRIEDGLERPAEDILMLLISYFNMQDGEALKLWRLAGYEGDMPNQNAADSASDNGKPVTMLLALDARTVYTDSLDITCNQAGVTLSFNQLANQAPAVPVARLGMSYEQAELVLATLQQALIKAKYLRGPKGLPPGSAV